MRENFPEVNYLVVIQKQGLIPYDPLIVLNDMVENKWAEEDKERRLLISQCTPSPHLSALWYENPTTMK
jgi:hypothetical protein